jgi:hypothetical protein
MPTNTWKYKVENSRFVFDWEIITLPSVGAECCHLPAKIRFTFKPDFGEIRHANVPEFRSDLSVHAGGIARSPATLNLAVSHGEFLRAR